ncbi:hypothetical protein EKE94_03305 [Mesobaculum littorinae]|uniref:Uncharacterized protein n=1 Tax=Mesobaculum littorinae TaxID=2486419 RepID=A0A438AM37_9RHOB|nr:hypothetical protein [Mesobaculum littorinae]RVV99720.1 hypothetical protein EKE94_03305 [Mesobaculum littorinae]
MTRVYEGAAVRALYGQLVKDFGGPVAVGAFLGISQGTVSKQTKGEATIGCEHYGPLEDELERFPITDLMDGRRDRMSGQSDVQRLAMIALKETGDLGPAVLDYIATGDPTKLRKEGPEAGSALDQLMQAIIDGHAPAIGKGAA